MGMGEPVGLGEGIAALFRNKLAWVWPLLCRVPLGVAASACDVPAGVCQPIVGARALGRPAQGRHQLGLLCHVAIVRDHLDVVHWRGQGFLVVNIGVTECGE